MKMSTKDINEILIKLQGEIFAQNYNTTEGILQVMIELIMKKERNYFLSNQSNNKGNGFYKRFLKTLQGKIQIKVPRDRNNLFNPFILEIMKKEEKQYCELIKELYFKGMTHKEIQWLIKKIYGDNVSSWYISHMTNKLYKDFKVWQKRKLKDEYSILQIDTIYQKIKRWNKYESEGFTAILWVKYDWTREILGIYSTPVESIEWWKDILLNLKERWLKSPLLIISDWIKYFENKVEEVYPKARFQKCIVHKKRNILNRVRSSDKEEIAIDLKNVFKIKDINDNKQKAINRLEDFIKKRWKKYPFIKNSFNKNETIYYFTYLEFPYKIRSKIYTTNWLERFNKSVRKKFKIRDSLPNEKTAMKLIYFTILEQNKWVYNYSIGVLKDARYELEQMLEKIYK